MDDFGKGYSSLSYLHQFPFDTLKIDRSFIARIGVGGENAEIVRTIVSLGTKVSAWTSSPRAWRRWSQLTLLQGLGCHFGQGFFFSRPLSAEAVAATLAEPPQWFADSRGLATNRHDQERDKVEVGRTAPAQALM